MHITLFFFPLQPSEEREIMDLLLMKILSFLGMKCKNKDGT